ncbi:MAG: phosphatase PAP2 family protein [candidate division KSB1 bacterium]|nr:phosphatase PAP2 family protein [candidate division KSB1 bacterium]MDZ7358526.1 phosphatase PAP2 family protein [candidate division KSB1 bacterium]
MEVKNTKYLIVLFEVISLIVLTLIISYFKLDFKVQELFYRAGSESAWYQKDSLGWRIAYHYGTLPAILLTFFACVGLILSWMRSKMRKLRRHFLFIILTLAIGPGLVVNAILKDHWGRPRPRQVQEFAGKWEFKEIWEPGTPGKGKSFPCGHCSMGFFFITLYYFWKQRRRALAYGSLLFSLVLGIYIGLARMAQGGHFLSDVVWSGGLTYLTAAILFYWGLKIPEHEVQSAEIAHESKRSPASPKKRLLIAIAGLLATAILIFIFLFSKPFYRESVHSVNKEGLFKIVKLHLALNRGDIIVRSGRFDQAIRIKTIAQGFGFPKYRYQSELFQRTIGDTLSAIYMVNLRGLFNELDVQTVVQIDSLYPIQISGGSEKGSLMFEAPKFKSNE